jgi:hypothetical protein
MSQVEERGSELVAICGVAVVRCMPAGEAWDPDASGFTFCCRDKDFLQVQVRIFFVFEWVLGFADPMMA